jgi:hypothetical protein
MHMRSLVSSIAVVLLAVPAGAQPVRITIEGTFPGASPIAGLTTGPFELRFDTQRSPTPTNVGMNWFELTDLAAEFRQGAVTTQVTGMTGFFTLDAAGGFSFAQTGQPLLLATQGVMLFTGAPATPTFLLGSFPVSDLVTLPGSAQRITIAEISVVPEPASIALMATGLILVGAAARRTRTTAHAAGADA